MAGEASDDALSTEEAATVLGVTPKTLRWMADRGEIPFAIDGRNHRYRRAELDAYLEGHRVQPGTLSHLVTPRQGTPVVRTLRPPRPPRQPVQREPRPPRPRVPRKPRTPDPAVTARREAAKAEAQRRAGERAAAAAERDQKVAERYRAREGAERIARDMRIGVRTVYSARDMRIGVRTVYSALEREGVPRRGSRAKNKVFSYADVFTEEILAEEYVCKRRSVQDIARETGCSESTVLGWLRRHGIPARGKTG